MSDSKPTLRGAQHAASPFNKVPIIMSHGGWIPDRPDYLNDWLEEQMKELGQKRGAEVEDKSIQNFRKLIETDSEVYMGFHRIFDNVPERDPLGRVQVTDYDTMLRLFNKFLKEAPKFDPNFLVFLPFTAVLQWPMAMTNGLTILVDSKVNRCVYELFNVWSEFLGSQRSAHVLTDDEKGWLGPEAMKEMPNFKDTFICDPSQPHWGFTSWDHFFARKLKDGARPVSSPGDPTVITSACESKVLRVAYNVQERDKFWIKTQPYSLVHMLNNHTSAQSFIGGTVYQAFLSPFYYHRWASPIDGVIEDFQVVAGTYFAGIPYDEPPPPDFYANQGQQSFIAHVATRALIFIRSPDPRIGLVCFIGIGMVEVSSCDVTVQKGQTVKKGDEIGTFHFGGSTHCLVFGPQTKLDVVAKEGELIPVHRVIANLV